MFDRTGVQRTVVKVMYVQSPVGTEAVLTIKRSNVKQQGACDHAKSGIRKHCWIRNSMLSCKSGLLQFIMHQPVQPR